MNVLILTPDAVGSTLLQRLITIYMQMQDLDRPVINLHELTNGLGRYFSPEFNQEIVNKKPLQEWGYFQSLAEVVEMLSSVTHYKTSRLAHYHIINRGDTREQQIPFYQYLNDNFYIIACRRQNVFEHALSLTIARTTKKLNVYSAQEKIETLWNHYREGFDIDVTVFTQILDRYRDYLGWSKQYFTVSSYFDYEQHLPQIENFILRLPIFGNTSNRIGWQQSFGQKFEDFNRMHYLSSDIGSLLLKNQKEETLLLQDQTTEPSKARDLVDRMLMTDTARLAFAQSQKTAYDRAQQSIGKMVDLGILVGGPPIKKQTLEEKRLMIRNWQDCVSAYHKWQDLNPDIGLPVDEQSIATQYADEKKYWFEFKQSNVPSLDHTPTEKS